MKAEQLAPDLEQKKGKWFLVSKTRRTWSQTSVCDSCADDRFCVTICTALSSFSVGKLRLEAVAAGHSGFTKLHPLAT